MELEWGANWSSLYDLKDCVIKNLTSKFKKAVFTAANDLPTIDNDLL